MLPPNAHKFVAALKDVGGGQPLLGCGTCADRGFCGDLHLRNTGSLVVSCMSYCTCSDRAKCAIVCPRKPKEFVRRHEEVDGWDLNNVPQARDIALPNLPEWIALFQGNQTGRSAWALDDVSALPLTLALTGRGRQTRARTREELVRSYGVKPRHGWVLSGTEDDPAVERVWLLPELSRTARQFVHAGAIFATTPDFSLLVDVPRYDNLHAMKRIAWAWYHMTQGGLCTALHLNARTDHDYLRWTDFIIRQPAVHAVATEFLTGTAAKASVDMHCERLARLATSVGRQLTLVIRGHSEVAGRLRQHFAKVVVIDSTPYMRSVKRRKAFIKTTGVLGHEPVRTETTRQTSALLRHNIKVHRRVAEIRRDPLSLSLSQAQPWPEQQTFDFDSPSNAKAHNETGQLALFPD